MKNKIYTGIAVIAVVMLISGASIMAVASPATSSDPLITLSYLNGPFQTAMNTHMASHASTLTNNFNARANQVEANVSNTLASNQAATFVLHTINNGQTINLSAGAELMLRSGSASIASGVLVNYTAGSEQSSGGLSQNNMYFSSEGGSITASSDNTRLLIRN